MNAMLRNGVWANVAKCVCGVWGVVCGVCVCVCVCVCERERERERERESYEVGLNTIGFKDSRIPFFLQ